MTNTDELHIKTGQHGRRHSLTHHLWDRKDRHQRTRLCQETRLRRKHWNVNVTSQATDKKPARASSDSCQGAKDEKESVQEARDTEKVIK